MTDSSETSFDSPTFRQFIAPLQPFQERAANQRRCHVVSDQDWVNAGLHRVIGQHDSGCAFVQSRVLRGVLNLKKSHYFESCQSTRRFQHLKGICDDFQHHHAQQSLKEDELFPGQNQANQANQALASFHVYAGDGHFHSASSHDSRDSKGRKNGIGHLYALNLRNHHLSHLALGSDGSNKKPHDMGVLKKLDIEVLRQGAQKGQKVLYIWDRAGIDFRQWYLWKNNNAIYFLSRVKANMNLEHPAPCLFDREDAINNGVIADELVGNSCGTMVRRVTFRSPDTGKPIAFLTNLGPSIAPGIVAQLYFMRWRVEKSFDEIKNKLHESKAWALSHQAKTMQALFITLAYNLGQLLHTQAAKDQHDQDPDHPQRDHASDQKRGRRLERLKQKVSSRGEQLPLLRSVPLRASQLSVKFYRWLAAHLYDPSPWNLALARLQTLYSRY